MTDSFIGRQVRFPSGIIIPWHGTVSDIPRGWLFCDGNNGTPDLRGRFLKSVPDSATTPGRTGGHRTQSLDVSQLPSHTHLTNVTSTDGAHTHEFNWVQYDYAADDDNTFENVPMTTGSGDYNGEYTNTSGSHTHPMTIDSTGESESYDNEPAHQTLTFIMKA